mmetsp:Transcript_28108/g.42195  ORF Transcript_28108/g.42195 Transcript_28108/m.42195 type:complete len:252 (+) Transcript_28108:580-1335(+)
MNLRLFVTIILDNNVSIGVNLSFIGFIISRHFLLRHLANELKSLSYKFLFDNFDNLTFLQRLAVDIERQIIRVNYTLDKVQVPRHQVEFIGDEDFSDIQPKTRLHHFHVSLLKRKWYFRGNIQNGFEVDVTLGVKVRPVLSITSAISLGNNLPKFLVFFVGNTIFIPRPNSRVSIDLFILVGGDLFHLWLLFFCFIFIGNLNIISILLLFFLFFVKFILLLWNLDGLDLSQTDRVSDKLRVMTNHFLEFVG